MFWVNRPSTPKRASSLKPNLLGAPKPATFAPTTATVTATATTTSAASLTANTFANPAPAPAPTHAQIEYPPHVAHDHRDAQWEHVKSGSPTSLYEDVNGEEDDDTLEQLGYSQLDGVVRERAPASGPAPLAPPMPAPTKAASAGVMSPVHWQEERDRMRQQVDAALTAQHKAESERDRWERKTLELRSNLRSERDRDRGDIGRDNKNRRSERDRDRDRELADAIKEENEKLKTMVQRQTQQLDGAREETTQARAQIQSELEKVEQLKRELDAAREGHKAEVDAVKQSLQEHVSRIEHLTMDRERVRKDRETIRANLSTDIEQLKQSFAKDIEQFKAAFEEVNQERMQAQADFRKVRKSLDSCAPRLDESRREIDSLHRELSSAKESSRNAADLKQRFSTQSQELQTAREESSALKKEFNQLAALLEDRTSELKGAQSFLTTADAFSGAEVTNTLQRLNAEVLQSTAFMAECMVEQFPQEAKPQVSKTDEQLAACKRASGAIGGSIVHFLGTKKHKEDPILIQIAFQAYLTYHLRWIACAWIIGGDENHNQFIDTIYRSVYEKEAQAIAGRWRALTRAHVPSTPLDDTQLAFQIASKVISGLSDILLTTGCPALKSDVSAALSVKFSEKLAFLISLAMRVNKIVGEDVTSGDFEVLAVPPGTAFDSAMMEDSYDDGGNAATVAAASVKGNSMSRVLCATDLGLRKKTRVGMTGEKQWETKMFLKPKVALESVIDILDE